MQVAMLQRNRGCEGSKSGNGQGMREAIESSFRGLIAKMEIVAAKIRDRGRVGGCPEGLTITKYRRRSLNTSLQEQCFLR